MGSIRVSPTSPYHHRPKHRANRGADGRADDESPHVRIFATTVPIEAGADHPASQETYGAHGRGAQNALGVTV